MKDRIFLDTNILVYLSDTGAEFHATVKEIFKDITEKYEIWISRQILREYAVVVSRKEDVEKPLKPQEITNDIAKWEISFRVIDETQEITENLKNLILKYNLKGKRIHDANIVASMMEYSIPLLFTFNVRDFQVFEEVQLFEIQQQEDTQLEPNDIILDGDIQPEPK
jgi:predicted nucleic acid-binding protein